jgi:hypothetical protein
MSCTSWYREIKPESKFSLYWQRKCNRGANASIDGSQTSSSSLDRVFPDREVLVLLALLEGL